MKCVDWKKREEELPPVESNPSPNAYDLLCVPVASQEQQLLPNETSPFIAQSAEFTITT